jgi:hypothetical protein
VSLHLSSIPSLQDLGLPDASSLPLPSVSDVSDAVSDVIVTAFDTASDAATVVVATARRRPKAAIGVGVTAVVLMVVVLLLRRRRLAAPEQLTREDHKPRIAAA